MQTLILKSIKYLQPTLLTYNQFLRVSSQANKQDTVHWTEIVGFKMWIKFLDFGVVFLNCSDFGPPWIGMSPCGVLYKYSMKRTVPVTRDLPFLTVMRVNQ